MLNSDHPKIWKSFEDQLDGLIGRRLIVSDRARALDYLERIGYYRLSGYWFPMRELTGPCCRLTPDFRKPKTINPEVFRSDRFMPGASFENAVDLYVFDKKLRLLALDAIERIEVAVRVDIAHSLGQKDRFAYLIPGLFHKNFSEVLGEDGLTKHHKWLTKQAALIVRSKEEFITHNKQRYGLPIPIWVSCEVWDFGALSTLFGGMKEADQDAISCQYGVSNGRVFASWLRSVNFLRNVCAHHSRLWNRNVVDQPKLPSEKEVAFVSIFKGQERLIARPFLLFCILRHLMLVVNPTSSWPKRFVELMHDFPDLRHVGLDLASMGAGENWLAHWSGRQ
ncbi:Abi family protein [Rhizobium sp. CC-YZS058]|uniref:Abi family protein n=1 Tax=Rhizobium sp. CC-YZS058 TaxID=3042153 RepID=UPI002B06090E|nr:Abi family protein [Rhizobium sp. CC-YZS058]MEA3536465.1 Abi family protein [Rhizobium sp. CC-YZS058]